jgi:hypothetical protein
MRQFALTLWCVSISSAPLPAFAQRATIQEPSLESFGVGTTVSVPDRGRMKLGGVGRGASGSSVYGPLRSGTNTGRSTQGGSISIGVRIHDLAEMDRQTLELAGKARRERDNAPLPRAAENAYEALRARPKTSDMSAGARSAAVATTQPVRNERTMDAAQDGPSIEKLLERAHSAEADGKRELALTYLRAARNMGSAVAQKEIDRLDRKKRR